MLSPRPALHLAHPRKMAQRQMIGVAHQHLGVNAPAGFLAGLPQSFQEPPPVGVVPEDRLAVVAPRHHVIDGTLKLDSRSSWHTISASRAALEFNEKLNEDLISRSRDQILGSRGPWLARQPLAVWEMVRPREEIVGLAAAVRAVDCGGRMLRGEDEASLRWGTEPQESSCRALRCTQSTIGAHPKPASASRRSRPVIRCGGRRNHG